MIKNVTVTNHLGEAVTMELRSPEKSGFLILGIDGLGPSKATINKTELSTLDGSVFNSSRVSSRNIVFSIVFLDSPSIEYIRHKSYKYFPIKRQVKVLIETDDRTCEVYGYIESNEPNIFSKTEGSTISVICPDAYLYSTTKQVTLFSYVESLFEFPFSNESLSSKLIVLGELHLENIKTIYYEGDSPVGITIYVHAIGSVNNLAIVNFDSGETIAIDSTKLVALTGYDISAGDDIIISTVKGNKFAILQRGGVTTNIFNTLELYPDWFQIEKGNNLFTYTADSGSANVQLRIENQIAYEGV